MQDVAEKEYGFEIIYGDTDSLFLHKTTETALKEFQERFNSQYDIELEIKNRYNPLLLSAGKKHYVGLENGEFDIVGYEGEKSDRCALQHNLFMQILEDILKNKTNPLPKVIRAFADLDANTIDPKLLELKQKVNKSLDKYDPDSRIYKMAIKYKAKQGDVIPFFNADTNKTEDGESFTQNPSEIDIVHYKGLLFNVIAEILEIPGHDIVKLAQQVAVKIGKDKRYKKKAKSKKKKDEKKKDNEILRDSIGNINSGTGGESQTDV